MSMPCITSFGMIRKGEYLFRIVPGDTGTLTREELRRKFREFDIECVDVLIGKPDTEEQGGKIEGLLEQLRLRQLSIELEGRRIDDLLGDTVRLDDQDRRGIYACLTETG